MSKSLPRRSFVKRFSLAIASAFVVPSVLSNEKINNESKDDEDMNPIEDLIAVNDQLNQISLLDFIKNLRKASIEYNKLYFDYSIWQTDHSFTNKRASLINMVIAFLER